mgnify:CR=1 FL=1
MKFSIKLLYLYLFSFIGLIITVIGTVQLVDLGIKVYIFKGADKYEYYAPKMIGEAGETIDREEEKRIQERESARQRQRQVSTAVSMIIVGLPLYLYHWRKIKD